MLVFVPLDWSAFLGLAQGQVIDRVTAWRALVPDLPGPAPTGVTDADETELAEHEAMVRASFDGLARFGLRLVVAVDLPTSAWPGDDPTTPGRGRLDRLERRRVTAFFADDPADLQAVQAAGQALAGQAGDQAWSRPAAQFLAGHPLMWFDATELNQPVELPTVGGLRRLNA